MLNARFFGNALLTFLLAIALAAPLPTSLADAPGPIPQSTVGPVPDGLHDRLNLSPFYQQHLDVRGLPVLGSAKVSKYALLEAAYLVEQTLGHRPDILKAMAENKVRLTVMAVTEYTTDVPEHSDLKRKDYWDRRARGLGATVERPCVSAAEENLLGLRGDPYAAENILIHEFAHAVHEMGMSKIDPTFDTRLRSAYRDAMDHGLWQKTYAATDRQEYFAEGVQSWFDTNRKNDNAHNDISTREKLKAYDPTLAKLIEEVYGDREWRYVHPSKRKDLAHLTGLDRDAFPAFKWRDR
jgi:hypothetical protein